MRVRLGQQPSLYAHHLIVQLHFTILFVVDVLGGLMSYEESKGDLAEMRWAAEAVLWQA